MFGLNPGGVDALISSSVTLLTLALCGCLFLRARRSDVWRNAFAKLWRRRKISVLVVALYASVAAVDSLTWVGGESEGDQVAAQEARSLIDRAFVGFQEKSYSAPLATTKFYDDSPLNKPGRHLLGTNIIGQDVFYITLKGAKVALLIGGVTSLIAIPLALFFGMLAGYFGGKVDDVIFFVMSTLASMPSILLLVALIMALGQGTLNVCLALGVTSWVGFSRLARGETMKLREMDYVLAAKSLGASDRQILLKHILPNLSHLVLITFVLMFSGLVIAEAALAWLGIGVDGSWGQMIAQAKNELSREPVIWWNLGAASVAIFVLLLSVNLIGDTLRDVLDPRTLKEDA